MKSEDVMPEVSILSTREKPLVLDADCPNRDMLTISKAGLQSLIDRVYRLAIQDCIYAHEAVAPRLEDLNL